MHANRDAAKAIFRVRAADEDEFLILHLRRKEQASGESIVLAVVSAISWPDDFEALLRNAFGLSSAEIEVVRLLLNCQSAPEIAKAQRRSLGITRSQIKTIQSKTETHGHVELVRLILSRMDIARLTAEHSVQPVAINGGAGSLPALLVHTIYDADDRRLDYLIIGDCAGRPILYMPTEFAYLRWPAT